MDVRESIMALRTTILGFDSLTGNVFSPPKTMGELIEAPLILQEPIESSSDEMNNPKEPFSEDERKEYINCRIANLRSKLKPDANLLSKLDPASRLYTDLKQLQEHQSTLSFSRDTIVDVTFKNTICQLKTTADKVFQTHIESLNRIEPEENERKSINEAPTPHNSPVPTDDAVTIWRANKKKKFLEKIVKKYPYTISFMSNAIEKLSKGTYGQAAKDLYLSYSPEVLKQNYLIKLVIYEASLLPPSNATLVMKELLPKIKNDELSVYTNLGVTLSKIPSQDIHSYVPSDSDNNLISDLYLFPRTFTALLETSRSLLEENNPPKFKIMREFCHQGDYYMAFKTCSEIYSMKFNYDYKTTICRYFFQYLLSHQHYNQVLFYFSQTTPWDFRIVILEDIIRHMLAHKMKHWINVILPYEFHSRCRYCLAMLRSFVKDKRLDLTEQLIEYSRLSQNSLLLEYAGMLVNEGYYDNALDVVLRISKLNNSTELHLVFFLMDKFLKKFNRDMVEMPAAVKEASIQDLINKIKIIFHHFWSYDNEMKLELFNKSTDDLKRPGFMGTTFTHQSLFLIEKTTQLLLNQECFKHQFNELLKAVENIPMQDVLRLCFIKYQVNNNPSEMKNTLSHYAKIQTPYIKNFAKIYYQPQNFERIMT